jgi:hypothetical protein
VAETALQFVRVVAGYRGEGERETCGAGRAGAGGPMCPGSGCSASCQRPICSQMVLIERADSRPFRRREPIEAADRNSAVDSAPASAGRFVLWRSGLFRDIW